jgi:hypothetical protein
MVTNKPLSTIGIHEQIHIPKSNITSIECKIDTGAYNSAIDCSYTNESHNENGDPVLTYTLLNENHQSYTGKKLSTKKFKSKEVKSSNGIKTIRYQIKLSIEIKGKKIKSTFNLSDRKNMRYPVLIGRKVLANRFLVDVSKNRKLKKSE